MSARTIRLGDAQIKRLEDAIERESRNAAHHLDASRRHYEQALEAQQATLAVLREIADALAACRPARGERP